MAPKRLAPGRGGSSPWKAKPKTTTKPSGGSQKPPPPTGGARTTPGLTVAQQAAKEAQMYIDMMMAQIQAEQNAYQAEIDRQVRMAQERAMALARALEAMGMPTAINNLFQNAAQSQAGLAQGFSQELQGSAAEQAAQMNNMLAGTGQTARNEGQAMGDVLYGVGGFIPGQTFAESGAGYAANAALQPSFAMRQGAADAARILSESQDEMAQFAAERAKARSQYPSYYQEALSRAQENRDRLKDEVYKLYQAGLITKREMGRRLGIPGWKKMPATYADEAEASAPLTREIGGYLYQYNPKNGKWIPVAGQGNPPKTVSQGGYIWQQDPKTGKWVPVGGTGPKPDKPNEPSPYQHVEVGGKVYVFDPNTGIFYDPKTGKPTVPKAPKGSAKPLTGPQAARFKKWAYTYAQDALRGGYMKDPNNPSGPPVRDPNYPPLSLGQAIAQLQEAIQGSGMPGNWKLAAKIVTDYYKKYYKGPFPPYPPQKGGGKGKGASATGPMYGNQLQVHISQEASKLGLDAAAVLAVASTEGSWHGAVGDSGQSFGPFQLYAKGALPPSIWRKGAAYARRWANSPAGIAYALRRIASVARGLSGYAAIQAIVTRFERPADPESQIAKAWERYEQFTVSA